MKNKKLSRIILFFILIILVFTSISVNVSAKTYKIKNSEYIDSYIIEFEEKPLIEFFKNIKNKISESKNVLSESLFKQEILEQKEKIINIQNSAIQDIKSLINKDQKLEDLIKSRFTKVINGILIQDITVELANKIQNLPYVKRVEKNIKLTASLDESIPIISADDVWKLKDNSGFNITGKGISIAILDTGVDYNHLDIENYRGGWDFVNNDNDPMDDNSHGTHCAGIALGSGRASGYQYIGVAPEADLYAVKILNSLGSGNLGDFIDGVEFAIDPNNDDDYSDHVDIISLSLETQEPGTPTDILCTTVDNAVDLGVVVIAAAGNNGPGPKTISSPGAAQKVITVGATSKLDNIYPNSGRGPVEWDGNTMTKPDLVAPGVAITSSLPGNNYGSKTGTSMATPHVAGAAALVLQANPNFSPEEVKNLLKFTTDYVGADENTFGSGRLNVSRAIMADTDLIIQCPQAVLERDDFTVKAFDLKGNPIKIAAILLTKYHLPQIKFGETLEFKAPMVFRNRIDMLTSKLIILTLDDFKIITRYIEVYNNF
jgi:serine protease AprX